MHDLVSKKSYIGFFSLQGVGSKKICKVRLIQNISPTCVNISTQYTNHLLLSIKKLIKIQRNWPCCFQFACFEVSGKLRKRINFQMSR